MTLTSLNIGGVTNMAGEPYPVWPFNVPVVVPSWPQMPYIAPGSDAGPATLEPFPLPDVVPTAPSPPAMSPSMFARVMREIFPNAGRPSDQPDDCTHNLGDELLCRVLRDLGYGEGVAVFEAAAKWYA